MTSTLLKFLIAGSFNTLFYYTMYALLIYLNVHYSTAVLLATVITMFVSFKTFGKFVFQKSDNSLIFRFIALTVLNYILNIIIIYVIKGYGYNDYIAGIVSAVIVAINSFVLNKFFVFR